jgi:hypothetical protein
VIAIEEKLDVRGKVVSGVMRGPDVRRGAAPSISVGDLFPFQTKYGKIYKILVYRGVFCCIYNCLHSRSCKEIDDYFEYRMRPRYSLNFTVICGSKIIVENSEDVLTRD